MATASAFSMFSLEGQTALITGATRGIGQEAAIALAECGADIVLIQVYFIPPKNYTPRKLANAEIVAGSNKHCDFKGHRSIRQKGYNLHSRSIFPSRSCCPHASNSERWT
jgi:2-deoxy-D-gluconate 3-dehydrogenase